MDDLKTNTLKPINIILTAVGCPGASTCIRYLKSIKERKIKVIGVDAEKESIGRFLADKFYQIPSATDVDYIDTLLTICHAEKIDCIVVSSSYEVEVIAAAKSQFDAIGVKVLASDASQLKIANDKQHLYEYFEDNALVKVPEFKVVNSLGDFIAACDSMGYPAKSLCFKPPKSKGSRGFRLLTESISRKDLLLHYKPESKYMSLGEFEAIFKDEADFPTFIIMETLQGEEIDSMVLANQGEALLITHKTREKARGGVITHGGHCQRPALDAMICEVLKHVKLSYNVGFQFMDGHLIEINPRLSSFIYSEDWVEPYFAIKLALGEYNNDDVKALQQKVPEDLRMLRYFDQYFYDKHILIES